VIKTMSLAVFFVLSFVAYAFADFTPPTLSTAQYKAVAGAIFTALGVIWELRKVIKLLNKP
jgi:hypothetical protein